MIEDYVNDQQERGGWCPLCPRPDEDQPNRNQHRLPAGNEYCPQHQPARTIEINGGRIHYNKQGRVVYMTGQHASMRNTIVQPGEQRTRTRSTFGHSEPLVSDLVADTGEHGRLNRMAFGVKR